jgi:RNA polymerase sigma factor (sigma-70 family)
MDMASGRSLVLHYIRTVAADSPGSGLTDGQLLARFAACRDEAAFVALVRRHGPMVLGVCRRVLGDWHAAEDAFQATFLVLARKAGSLRGPDRLPAWLHGVAHRTAAKARVAAARRRAHEGRAAAQRPTQTTAERPLDDLRVVLDEEITRLPARHRSAFVLCYLEGKTNAEAARLLGCPRGSVATLLARARLRLRRRLQRRGLGLSAGLAAAVSLHALPAEVPVALATSTARTAALLAAGKVPAGLTRPHVAALAEGVLRSMMLKKIRLTSVILLALAGTAGSLAAFRASAEEPAGSQPAAPHTAAPPVVHQSLPEPPDHPPSSSPTTVRTENFIVTAPSRETAALVARAAEDQRKTIARLWLDKELPPWPAPCTIHVASGVGLAGATAFTFDPGKAVLSEEMRLEGPTHRILADGLPHEMTHVVLAHWARRPLPRWADEGMAILAEGAASQVKHELQMWNILDNGRMRPLGRLLPLTEFPPDVMVLYAQGHSLTAFLVQSRGRSTFLKFLDRAMRDGWNSALRKFYAYRDIDELEQAWLAQIRAGRRLVEANPVPPPPAGDAPVPPRPTPAPPKRLAASVGPQPKGQLPPGTPPQQALASLDEDGRLVVWTSVPCVEPRTYWVGNVKTTAYVSTWDMAGHLYTLAEVSAYDVRGKKIGRKKLPVLLKEETVVLVSTEVQVNPLHLRLCKEGTLLLVLPAPPLAAVPPTVAPPAVAPPLAVPTPPPPTAPPAAPVVPPPPTRVPPSDAPPPGQPGGAR